MSQSRSPSRYGVLTRSVKPVGEKLILRGQILMTQGSGWRLYRPEDPRIGGTFLGNAVSGKVQAIDSPADVQTSANRGGVFAGKAGLDVARVNGSEFVRVLFDEGEAVWVRSIRTGRIRRLYGEVLEVVTGDELQAALKTESDRALRVTKANSQGWDDDRDNVGVVVGDEDDGVAPFKLGEMVELCRDDGSDIPLFKSYSPEDCKADPSWLDSYLHLDDVRPLPRNLEPELNYKHGLSPAHKRGLFNGTLALYTPLMGSPIVVRVVTSTGRQTGTLAPGLRVITSTGRQTGTLAPGLRVVALMTGAVLSDMNFARLKSLNPSAYEAKLRALQFEKNSKAREESKDQGWVEPGPVTAEDMDAKLNSDMEPGFVVFASDLNSVQLAQAVLDNRIAKAAAREGGVDADEVDALKEALDDLIVMKNWLLNNPEDK